MNPLFYLFAAYLIFLLVICFFLFRLLVKLNRLEAEIQLLHDRDTSIP